MKNEKVFISASILLMLSVICFFVISYPEITKEFPQYDPVYHKYVPKSEVTRQEEMRYSENFPGLFYIIIIRPLFLYFAVFSVVFYMLWYELPCPTIKQLLIAMVKYYKDEKNKRLIKK